MNRNQRNKNRANARWLEGLAHVARLQAHTCENCGEKGGHWIQTEMQTLEDILAGRESRGFWACPMYYGADGRRLPEHTNAAFTEPNLGRALGAALFTQVLRSNTIYTTRHVG
jgi:hypothetical protein